MSDTTNRASLPSGKISPTEGALAALAAACGPGTRTALRAGAPLSRAGSNTGLALGSFALLLALGCGSDETTALDPDVRIGGLRDAGPSFAVTSRVFGSDPNAPTSFLWLVDSLDQGSLELTDAVELPGGASLWGVEGSGVFYVVSAEELTVTKYVVSDGVPESIGRMGLIGQGISSLLGERMVFADGERAFFFDLGSARALELNLAEMQITRTLDISAVLLDGAELSFLGETGFRRYGDRWVTSVYGTSANFDRVTAASKLLLFNPVDGSFEVESMPCGGLNYAVDAPGGDIYFAADTYVASVHLIDARSAPAPCLARLTGDAGDVELVAMSLNELTGAPTGGLIPGSDGSAYVRVLDSQLYSPRPDSIYLEAFSAAAWQTWRIDLADPARMQRIRRAPLAGGIRVFQVAGDAYENESTSDFGSTTLVRTTGAGAPAPGLTMPGVTWGIVRVH